MPKDLRIHHIELVLSSVEKHALDSAVRKRQMAVEAIVREALDLWLVRNDFVHHGALPDPQSWHVMLDLILGSDVTEVITAIQKDLESFAQTVKILNDMRDEQT